MEAKQMKSEVVVFGLNEVNGETCAQTVKKFFTDVMKIESEIEIVQGYWKGKAKNKPAIVKLENLTVKGVIFAHVSNLKGQKNEQERSY